MRPLFTGIQWFFGSKCRKSLVVASKSDKFHNRQTIWLIGKVLVAFYPQSPLTRHQGIPIVIEAQIEFVFSCQTLEGKFPSIELYHHIVCRNQVRCLLLNIWMDLDVVWMYLAFTTPRSNHCIEFLVKCQVHLERRMRSYGAVLHADLNSNVISTSSICIPLSLSLSLLVSMN